MSRSRRFLLLVRKHEGAVGAVSLLVLFFAAMFRYAFTNDAFVVIGDPLVQLYPLRTVAWDMIRAGELPFWTPHILSGYPLSGMVMLGLTYPLTWAYLFIRGPWAEQIYILAPYLLSPLFTYAFVRRLGRSHIAAALAGLVFGYGGFLFSPIGLTGVHANSALWLPLLLLGVARAHRGRFLPALLLSTFAFTMSVLAGSGQLFLYGGSLALGYALFLTLVRSEDDIAARSTPRWQPLAVAAGAILLSAGLTAYQLLETWALTGVSVRRAYPPERFAEGSFEPLFALQSLLQPLGNFWDSATYVPLLALVFAVIAAARAVVAPRRFAEVLFWLFVAVLSWILILGNQTSFFGIYSRLPLVSRFRYPSRHTLEWTLAIGVLAAYGWDFVSGWIAVARGRRAEWLSAATATALTIAAAAVALRWASYITATKLGQVTDLNNARTGLDPHYLGHKAAFALLLLGALLLFRRMAPGAARSALIAVAVAFHCFVEPYLWLVRPIVLTALAPAAQFTSLGRTTALLKEKLGPHERSYSIAHPYEIEFAVERESDAVNWTALAGIQDVNGYESLILERYSKALRGVVDGEPFIHPDPSLLSPASHVLDLLNTRFVTAPQHFAAYAENRTVDKDGISFSMLDLAIDLPRGVARPVRFGGFVADTLAVVTNMGMSGDLEDGHVVAEIVISTVDGRTIKRQLRAGDHTAEWAHERSDVRPTIAHRLAPIFDSTLVDAATGFSSHRFLGRIELGERVGVERIDFINITAQASVGLWKAALHDTQSNTSRQAPAPAPGRWRIIRDANRMVVLENTRALPRAWLVSKVESAGSEEIVRRIRGESAFEFDPRVTALVDAESELVPVVDGGAPSPGDEVRIVSHRPNEIIFDTRNAAPAFLVVSEIDYRGWSAFVDGKPTPIHKTNYLLRGVSLPAGNHRVVMRYRPVAAMRGAAVSAGTASLLFALVMIARRRSRPAA